jgi:ATP-binding cassette subfamily B protein
MDAVAEQAVFHAFRAMAAGRTVLLISHRFSTVKMADRIFVLKEGTVAERGSHDELMALGGLYARMFEAQAESYR